jgi:ATP-binding cassette subfamily F protein uup
VFEGNSVVREYAGGYDDWLRQSKRPAVDERGTQPASVAKPPPARPPVSRPRRLSFKEQKELDSLPQTIIDLEQEQQDLHQTLADPAFYRQDGGAIAQTKARLSALEHELAQAYQRWEALEQLR